MKVNESREWIRLDNAAIMFPAGSNSRNTRVFRFTCELTEDVDPEILQQALDEAVRFDPGFVCAMRNGVFWHYLERSRDIPTVHEEKYTPCVSIYSANKKRLLFYVSYYRSRIHVEFFHALTDGTGGLFFIRMLAMRYLRLKHREELFDAVPAPEYGAPVAALQEDSFNKNYSLSTRRVKISMPKAYQIKGKLTEDKHYNFIEGVVSAKAMLEFAHRHNCTLTSLLTALYVLSIGPGMPEAERKLPVVITIPVNLRNHFDSETIRNFFVTTSLSYCFAEREGTLDDLIAAVQESLAKSTTKEALTERMDSLVCMQRDPLMRLAPLPLKDLAIGISKKANEKGETAVISNVSRVQLPEPMRPYVKGFGASSSTSNMHLCIVTYGDRMALTFSSSFEENDVARRFFRALTAEGIEVELTTNYNQK